MTDSLSKEELYKLLQTRFEGSLYGEIKKHLANIMEFYNKIDPGSDEQIMWDMKKDDVISLFSECTLREDGHNIRFLLCSNIDRPLIDFISKKESTEETCEKVK